MSKTVFYQTDFKPDYQLFQQKISQLTAEKSRVIKKEVNLQKLQHELELIKEQIDDQGLEFDQSPIFLKYASIQDINNKKKTASDCCLHCGQQMKKSVQCQICAEVYCKNCCWRKRVIPYAQHQDFRLSCEQCHQKYIKHFNNQQFYKEKGVYLAAIEELQRKYVRAKDKFDKKQGEVNQYKQQKRIAKIKQGNLKKALLDQEKRIKQLKQNFQQAVKQKALKIKQEQERKKRKQQEDKQRRQRQQTAKHQQEQREKIRQQEQRKLQQEASRLREQELARRQEEIRKQKENLQREKKELSESRLKQIEQLQKKKSQKLIEDNDDKPVIKFTEERDIYEEPGSARSSVKQVKAEPPRQVVSLEEIDFDQILKNAEEEQKPENQQKPEKSQIPSNPITQAKQAQKKPQEAAQSNLKQLLKEIKQNKKPQEKEENSQVKDEKSSKNKNESQKQEQKSVNEAPLLTMNQIKTMSINDLLSMKIPMNPQAKQKRPRKSSHPEIKVDGQENSTTTQNQKMYQSLLQPAIPQQSFMVGLTLPTTQGSNYGNNYGNNYGTNYGQQTAGKQQQLRNSIQSIHEDVQQSATDKQSNKKALLRRQSLISSVNKGSVANSKTPEYNDEQNAPGQPQKCTCEIM